VARFRREAPLLAEHIAKDKDTPAIRALWGSTRNFDENAERQIVHPEILRCIGAIGAIPMNGAAVHSGAMHTYGYLLTNLRTPYGFKRTRWTTPDLGRGLGVGNQTLRPYPPAGTLLANLTWILGRIAFDEGGAEAKRSRRLRRAISPAIVDWSPKDGSRLSESIDCRAFENLDRATLQTDLIPLIDHELDGHLLAYSLRRTNKGKSDTHRLLTAFPVTIEVVEAIHSSCRGEVTPRDFQGRATSRHALMSDPGSPQSREPIRLRYNAADPDLDGAELFGRRTLSHR